MSRKIFFAVLFVGFVFSVFGQSVTLDEIREYASGRQYATLKIITKYYMRDSSNAAWFDKQKESGNPSVVIERTKGQRDVIGATLLEEYRFETTFYNSANNLVISLDTTLQFLNILFVDPAYVPYLSENQYDRRKAVNEPSGSYTLRESAGAYHATDGANLFIKSYENTCAGIY
jgi:hypothetical protein